MCLKDAKLRHRLVGPLNSYSVGVGVVWLLQEFLEREPDPNHATGGNRRARLRARPSVRLSRGHEYAGSGRIGIKVFDAQSDGADAAVLQKYKRRSSQMALSTLWRPKISPVEVIPPGQQTKEDLMSKQRTDAEELTLAVAAMNRSVDRVAKLVASDDQSTRDHARYHLRRLDRTWLSSVVQHANEVRDPRRCVRYLQALGEIGQWDAEAALRGVRRALARREGSAAQDAAERAVQPLVQAVEEGRGLRLRPTDG
jgi:hypothetical protein